MPMGLGVISTYSLNEPPGVGDFEARYNSHSHHQARFSSRPLFFPTRHPSLARLRPHCRPGIHRCQRSQGTRAATFPQRLRQWTCIKRLMEGRNWENGIRFSDFYVLLGFFLISFHIIYHLYVLVQLWEIGVGLHLAQRCGRKTRFIISLYMISPNIAHNDLANLTWLLSNTPYTILLIFY